MDIVTDPKVDWLGLKWVFAGLSVVFVLAGGVSMAVGGLNLGVDFTGGTMVYVKFQDEPRLEQVREILAQAGLRAEEVIRYDDPSQNEVQIRMGRIEGEEAESLTPANSQVSEALSGGYDADGLDSGNLDLNNISRSTLLAKLQELDVEGLREGRSISEFNEHYAGLAAQIVDYRTAQSGLIREFSELGQLEIAEPLVAALPESFYLGSFTVISIESVGPKVGEELRARARDAILFSLLGMLIYIAVRFHWVYGLAAIVALFHDVFITVGVFSITSQEISLTVVAALLTLVGYSINDTIVVFDRVRENRKLMRRSDFATIINTSINQTLNRTIMTSGMTFLAVFSLFMFGGQVLAGFSFALVIGTIVGTYSSVAIATPIVLWWQNYSESRKRRA